MPLPNRKPNRLKEYDYSSPGAYFVTICTQNRAQTLGRIPVDKVVGDGFPVPHLSPIGQIAERCAQQISQKYPTVSVDSFVVMPNHIHLMLSFVQPNGTGNPSPTLGAVIGWYKYTVTVQANALLGTQGQRQLQRSFHDRVVRNAAEYAKLWNYIETNPARWREDYFYTENG